LARGTREKKRRRFEKIEHRARGLNVSREKQGNKKWGRKQPTLEGGGKNVFAREKSANENKRGEISSEKKP